MKTNSTSKIWNPVFVNAFVTNILLHLGIYMMNTLSAKYADHIVLNLAVTNPEYLETATTIVGMISGMFAATALIFKVVSGPMIDTFNRKHILVGASVLLMLSFAGYAISTTIPMLVVFRLLTGTAMAFINTVCLAIASQSLPSEKMASGIGYFALGTAVSQALAPTLGLEMVEAFGYQNAFIILAAVMGISAIYTSTMKFEFTRTKKFKLSLNSIIAKEALLPAMLMLLLVTTYSTINAFLVLYAESMNIENVGIYFTVYALTMLLSRPLLGKAADRFGIVAVCIPSMLMFALSFYLISITDSLWMLIVTALISAFGYGGFFPCLQALAMKSVPPERRGSAGSTCYIGSDAANLIGPILAGAVVDFYSDGKAAGTADYVHMWRFMILPIAAAFIFTVIFRKKLNNIGKNV